MISNPGKSFTKSFHRRMLELPTNKIALAGGGLVLSAASKALISLSHLEALALGSAPKNLPGEMTSAQRSARVFHGSASRRYFIAAWCISAIQSTKSKLSARALPGEKFFFIPIFALAILCQ